MQLGPTPIPCSGYDLALEDIQKSFDALRLEIVSQGDLSIADEIVPMTRWQWQKLFGNLQGLITELQIAERERVRKIMGQI
jgi:hypothetical protein